MKALQKVEFVSAIECLLKSSLLTGQITLLLPIRFRFFLLVKNADVSEAGCTGGAAGGGRRSQTATDVRSVRGRKDG